MTIVLLLLSWGVILFLLKKLVQNENDRTLAPSSFKFIPTGKFWEIEQIKQKKPFINENNLSFTFQHFDQGDTFIISQKTDSKINVDNEYSENLLKVIDLTDNLKESLYLKIFVLVDSDSVVHDKNIWPWPRILRGIVSKNRSYLSSEPEENDIVVFEFPFMINRFKKNYLKKIIQYYKLKWVDGWNQGLYYINESKK